MARYVDDSKEQVRDAADMVDLVSGYTELRRAGANRYEGLCPFHDERTPSFGIDPVKKLYHCFGCGAGGDLFKFVQEKEGLDFVGALELLADRYGVELQREEEDAQAAERRRRRERLYELLARTTEYYVRFLWESDEALPARRYLLGRGLEEQTLRDFRVGYAPSAWDRVLLASKRAGFGAREVYDAGLAQRAKGDGRVYDRFRSRIMFPLCDQRGRVLGFGARALREDQRPKYLNTAEGEVFHKGRQLFGADLARAEAARERELIVVEGYTDVLAMHQAGLRNCVGLMGTALTEQQVGEMARLVGTAGATVRLALDADASGQEAMIRAAELAAGRDLELRVVPLPVGSDPAELVAAEGPEAMRARMEKAVPFARFRVERVLAQADLESVDGRDRAWGQVRGPLAALPASALRQELVRLVASALDLEEELVAQLAAAPAPQAGGRPTSGARAALDRRERSERNFLALCIALPEPGRDALRRLDPERHFTGALTRRAARHLRDHAVTPLEGLDPDDGELSALLAELTLRASRGPADPAALDVELLQLEKLRLEREIAAAEAAGSPEVPELAVRRSQVVGELASAMDRATAAQPGV